LGIYHPQQIEFDRLNLTYTLLSKRKLLALVQNKLVRGWDDPRMPTISGMRRRGYTPEALQNFCGRIGVSKTNGITELSLPVGQLVILLILAALIGVGAAILPARRAAKLNVLEAISYE